MDLSCRVKTLLRQAVFTLIYPTLRYVVLILALIIAVIRPFLIFYDPGQHLKASYEAFAHILVGVLLGIWLQSANKFRMLGRPYWAMYTFWGLSILEVICFFISLSIK